MTADDWNAVIDTNLNSMFNVTKQVVPAMVEKGWGRIIQISSVNGEKGQAGQTNYSAAKAGMHGFTMALAQELADGPTWAIRWTKLAVNKAVKDQVNLIMDASFALEMATFRTEDHREAVRAFAEKRKPAKFKGR